MAFKKLTFLPFILVLAVIFTASGTLYAKANYEVVELSETLLMITPQISALEEEKGTKLTITSYKEVFKEAFLTLSTRYKIKTITPIEGFTIKEELIKIGGGLTVAIILEVEKK